MRAAWLLLTVFCLSACAAKAPAHDLPQSPRPELQSQPRFQEKDFFWWLADFKREARSQGISQQVLDDAFAHVKEPSGKVLERDHTQPEHTKSFAQYVSGVVTEKKIDMAREQWAEHRELLDRIEAQYGVPAPVLLALWGIESNFGELQGSRSIIESLTTLAYDGRRSAFFRKELLAALRILEEGRITAKDLTGSWAGAMGQIQFMPSSYLEFAVDFDGDGVKDIWQSEADALASMANYLSRKGWNREGGWGVRVELPPGVGADGQSTKEYKSLAYWEELGVRLPEGASLPQSLAARLILPDNDPSTAFLAFPDYDALMDWNHSTYFATSVGLLADAIAGQ